MEILIFSLLLAIAFVFTHPLALVAQSTPPISSHITVVGAVYCDTCLNNGFSRYSYFIPGADVHVQCRINADSPKTAETITFAVNRTTDNYGVYKLEIPSVDGVDCIDGPPIQSLCQATLIGSSSSACDVPALKSTTNEISVKSKEENLCVYSFAPLSFKPSKRNNTLCGKKAEEDSSDSSSSSSKFSSTKPTSLPLFNLEDPKTWIPHIPLVSQPPPPPVFDLRDPRTWTPLFPPFPAINQKTQNP